MKKFFEARKLKQLLLCVLPGAVAAVLVLWSCALQPDFMKRVDYRVYVKFLEHTSGGVPSNVPILIDIDEKSLAVCGQWPWPRYVLAELLAKLYEDGAAAVGVDILASEEDRTSPSLLISRMKNDFNVNIPSKVFPKDLLDNDALLAEVLKQVPAVMSCFLSNSRADVPTSQIRSLSMSEVRSDGASALADYVPGGSGLVMPLPAIARASRAVGFMNAEGDIDGLFRRTPLFLSYKGTVIPSLALSTLALAAGGGARPAPLIVSLNGDGPVSVKFSNIEIPLSHEGSLPVMFRRARSGAGSGVYPRYSACDILSGAVSADKIAGKIAFVGSTSAGLKDLRPTPFDTAYPGLELHAAVVDTILSHRFVSVPAWLPGAEFLFTLLAALAAIILFGLTPPLVYLSVSALAMFAVWRGALWIFVSKGLFISPTYSFAVVILSGFLTSGMRFWLEDVDKRMLKKAFSNYVSPEIVTQIMKEGSVDSLKGEEREITIIFTDIRGFTSMTEKLQPTQVVDLLARYFTPMTAIVRESGGTLDKFVGDALMAFWNAPVNVPEHPRRAIQALLDMQLKLAELNVSLQADFGIKLAMGGGIHTGVAQVGNMGTADLMNYTAIGDAVNTASRVEGMCSKYGSVAVVSGDTRSKCLSDFAWQRLDTVRVKGRVQGVELWYPMSFEEAERRSGELSLWAEAFALYEKGDFSATHDICARLANDYNNVKLYRIFEERCAELALHVPDQWDGILKYDSK